MEKETIRITVKLFATLRKDRFDVREMELAPETTVSDIISRLTLPEKEVSLVFINGRHAPFTQVLADGDVLALFPPVGGG